ncbi:hypothetical protein [Candidatus Nitrososphaera sp. FF02]|uniref:hypothetical protein n=1 Tax=Candidatus Nitrososphaera sp. FF02 TaxID=3398226 RepID=UPI0039E883D4
MKLFEQYMAMLIVGIGAYVGNLPLSVEVHEGGHYVVCTAYGYEAERIAWNQVRCKNPEHLFEYRLAGGMTAAAVLLWPLALWKRFKLHILLRAILIVSVGYAVSEFGKGIFEATDFQFYASDLGDRIFAWAGWITMLILGFFLRPRRTLQLSW